MESPSRAAAWRALRRASSSQAAESFSKAWRRSSKAGSRAAASSQALQKALPFSIRWERVSRCCPKAAKDWRCSSSCFRVAAACFPAACARSSSSFCSPSRALSWARATACCRSAWACSRLCRGWISRPSSSFQAAWARARDLPASWAASSSRVYCSRLCSSLSACSSCWARVLFSWRRAVSRWARDAAFSSRPPRLSTSSCWSREARRAAVWRALSSSWRSRWWKRSVTCRHTPAENRVFSISPLSLELARSSRRNSPWGSTITWENCSQVRWSSSSARRLTALSLLLSSRAQSSPSRRKHWWLSRSSGALVLRLMWVYWLRLKR